MGGGGRRPQSRPSAASAPDNSAMLAQMQAQQAAAAAAAAKAEAERQRQMKIQAEDDQARGQQLNSVQQAQRSLSGLQTSQQLQDAQSAQRQSMATSGLGGGGGFDINAAKMQALGNVAGAGAAAGLPYASGPAASGGAAPMGVPQGMIAANAQAGGTNAPQNRFALPQAQNLTFGGA